MASSSEILNNVYNANDNSIRFGSGSSTGSTVPGGATYIGVNSGGNLNGLSTPGTAANTTGSSVLASGIMAQVDDTSTGAVSEDNYRSIRMSADRSLLVSPRATTPAQTSVAASASSVNILASNTARKGATITNDSSAVMYVKLGSTASTTSYTVTIAGSASAPFSYYEVPFGYIGAIDAIWASATGNARITELT